MRLSKQSQEENHEFKVECLLFVKHKAICGKFLYLGYLAQDILILEAKKMTSVSMHV